MTHYPDGRIITRLPPESIAGLVDEQLAGIRARFRDRQWAERQRVQQELEREQARAWWREFHAREATMATGLRRVK